MPRAIHETSDDGKMTWHHRKGSDKWKIHRQKNRWNGSELFEGPCHPVGTGWEWQRHWQLDNWYL